MTSPQNSKAHARPNVGIVRANLDVEGDNVGVAAFGSRLLRGEVGFAANALNRPENLRGAVAPFQSHRVAQRKIFQLGLADFEVNPVVGGVLQRVKRHGRRNEHSLLKSFDDRQIYRAKSLYSGRQEKSSRKVD